MESNTSDGSIDARACQNPGVNGSFEDDLDFASSPQATYVEKPIELTLGMTVAQVATSIKHLSNRLLRELGYPPFTFGLITNLRDRTITLEFPSDAVEVPHIFVYPMNHGRPSEKSFSEGAKLGHVDLRAIERDGRSDRTLLRFSCNEPDWPEYEPRLEQLRQMLGYSGFQVHEENETEGFSHIELESVGRPSDTDYDWAFEEITVKGRARQEVRKEWLKRRARSGHEVPRDHKKAFIHAMNRRTKKKVGTK